MLLDRYQPEGEAETADLRRVQDLAEGADDPWRRDLPLHVTASTLVVHPPTGQVLLRWHQRQQAWLQVGGHGDPGESDPLAIARREAEEETGLADLVPWPDERLRHLVIVGVPAGKGEPGPRARGPPLLHGHPCSGCRPRRERECPRTLAACDRGGPGHLRGQPEADPRSAGATALLVTSAAPAGCGSRMQVGLGGGALENQRERCRRAE